MEFAELLRIVGNEPAFETGLLLAGDMGARDVRRQLSRWVAAGRIYQLRRGVYTLVPPYQKIKAHPFVLANRMVPASYVSCESALSHYGLIPEYVPVTVSVCTGRPGTWRTALGDYHFHHIKMNLFWGYRRLEVSPGQHAFVATPEKSLLDLLHLFPGSDSPAYLQELRLQNLDRLDQEALRSMAARTGSAKLMRAASIVRELAEAEAREYETL